MTFRYSPSYLHEIFICHLFRCILFYHPLPTKDFRFFYYDICFYSPSFSVPPPIFSLLFIPRLLLSSSFLSSLGPSLLSPLSLPSLPPSVSRGTQNSFRRSPDSPDATSFFAKGGSAAVRQWLAKSAREQRHWPCAWTPFVVGQISLAEEKKKRRLKTDLAGAEERKQRKWKRLIKLEH